MSVSPVTTRREDALLWLSLNRPERLNAVNEALYLALITEVERADGDPEVAALVLTGTGRAFSAGADLKAHAEQPRTEADRQRYARVAQRANEALQRCGKPVVAAVNGPAVGAGLELALSCDFVVVASDARLRLPELVLGTFFGGGLAHTLPQRVGLASARRILYLGDFFSGDEALGMGLADVAVPVERVREAARELAERLARAAPVSFRAAKDLLRRAPELTRDEVFDAEAQALAACMATREWAEGVRAFGAVSRPRDADD
jgi:enoyl-CoA hydratase/carnithine racemase